MRPSWTSFGAVIVCGRHRRCPCKRSKPLMWVFFVAHNLPAKFDNSRLRFGRVASGHHANTLWTVSMCPCVSCADTWTLSIMLSESNIPDPEWHVLRVNETYNSVPSITFIYTVSQKRRQYTLVHIFAKYWPCDLPCEMFQQDSARRTGHVRRSSCCNRRRLHSSHLICGIRIAQVSTQ